MVSQHPISISVVELGPEVEELVLQVIRSGTLAQGPMVQRLEQEFATMCGVDHVVAVSNGTVALAAALQVLGLGPGDEVITSPFTFVATLNAILSTGATARFGDISTDDFALTPASAAALVNERTRAVMPVHLYGQCADMPAFVDLADEHGLVLVEDAAQAHGATVAGRPAGSFGTGCFSLYATKNLTSGEGGFVTTDDPVVADRLRLLRNQGMRQRYRYEMPGNNYRMTDLQAAVCLPQLPRYAEQVAARRANAARLRAGLADLAGLTLPAELAGRGHVWHQFTVLVGPESAVDRDGLAAGLADLGIGSGIYYPNVVHDHDCYRSHPNVVADDSPVAFDVARRCLSLPVHPGLGTGDLDRIVDAVRMLHG
jgi:perosamine synthetase